MKVNRKNTKLIKILKFLYVTASTKKKQAQIAKELAKIDFF